MIATLPPTAITETCVVTVAHGQMYANNCTLAYAAPKPTQHAFCAAWGRFGDNPSYGNFTAVHVTSSGANHVTRSRFDHFQAVLLAGYPVNVIRSASDAVWAACGN
jgi:hypothetical protein